MNEKYAERILAVTICLISIASFCVVNIYRDRYVEENYNIQKGERIWFVNDQLVDEFFRSTDEIEIAHNTIGNSVIIDNTEVSLKRANYDMYLTVGDEIYIIYEYEEGKTFTVNNGWYTIYWEYKGNDYWITEYSEYYYAEVDDWSIGIFHRQVESDPTKELIYKMFKSDYSLGEQNTNKFNVFIFMPQNEVDDTTVILVKGELRNRIKSGYLFKTSLGEIKQIAESSNENYIYKISKWKCKCNKYDTDCGFTLKSDRNGLIIKLGNCNFCNITLSSLLQDFKFNKLVIITAGCISAVILTITLIVKNLVKRIYKR